MIARQRTPVEKLLEAAKGHVMTDEEIRAQRESWVRGEMGMRETSTMVRQDIGEPTSFAQIGGTLIALTARIERLEAEIADLKRAAAPKPPDVAVGR